VPRGEWWQSYQDGTLNALENTALKENLNLKAAMARVNQARALARGAEAAFMPVIAAGANATRSRTSANRPYALPNSTLPSTVQNDFVPSASVRWEADLSGRLSSTEAAALASADQVLADQESVKLAITTNVALTYFSLRALDADMRWLKTLEDEQSRALKMIQRRFELGQANALDILPIEAQLQSTRVQIETLKNQRPAIANALATLTNVTPQALTLAEGSLPITLHPISAGIPSDLLQRRPDIASSERAVALANAQIGIAESARYPALTLSGSLGAESRALTSLLNAPSALWAFGLSVTQTIFDGGRIESSVQAARAQHENTVANYRATVLSAVNEVETALAQTVALEKSWQAQQALVASEEKQLQLVKKRHNAGQGTAYDVVFAEETVSSAQRVETQLYAQRVLADIYLFKALGGGWEAKADQGNASADHAH
jgi:NodT family efflux transporter outer membrane factor (OMF) lipoprotein